MQELTGTKEKIFDAAVDLFSKHGYNGASIRKIAYGAGIKESSIYNHFAGKEEILNCIFRYFQEGMQTQRAKEDDLAYELEFMAPRELFRLLFIRYLKNRNPRIDKIATIILAEQYTNPIARDFVQRYMLREPADYYEALLKTLAAKERIRGDINLRIAAEELNYGFLGIIFEIVHSVQEGRDGAAVMEKLSNHVDFVFERLEKPAR